MALILLRHTRPLGAEGICYGRTDLALAPDFEADAAAIMAALPAVDRIVTSPLSRCRLLADRIGAARGIAVDIDPRIVEFDFGTWEGKPWSAIPRTELDAWSKDFHGARPHGGESVAVLGMRVAEALRAARADGARVLWVSHAGVAKAVGGLLGLADGWNTRLEFGSWMTIAPDSGPGPEAGGAKG